MGRVRKQAKWQPIGLEQQSPLVVLKNAWSVSGIDVAQGSDLFVVTTDERGRETDSAGGGHDGLIHLEQKMGDGISVFDIRVLVKLRAALAEDILRGCGDVQS